MTALDDGTPTTPILKSSTIPTPPGRDYTAPGVFAAEQERIFETSWVCIALSLDVADTGAFVTADVGRESVLAVRGRDGLLRAFLNVCRHRGARICSNETGQVRRNLQCSYHAWTYDLTGALVAAPNLAEMPDVDRSGLFGVALCEWEGMVWVSLADQPPSFADTVTGAVTERLGDPLALEHYGIGALRSGRRIRYDVAANWKLIVENFMECYHCATIHPELTDVLPEFADGLAAQYYVGHGAEFAADVEGFTVDGRAGTGRLSGLTEEQDRRYYAVTIRPQVFVNLVPDHVIVHRMTPVAADRTTVICDWLFDPAVIDAGTNLDASIELFHRVNLQDFEACERTQPGMASRAYRDGGVLVPSEHHIAEFHRWVADRLA